MKVLLTGASGFAGAHMLKYLLMKTDAEIVCPVTYSHGGHSQRIPALIEDAELYSRFSLIKLDLADHTSLDRLNFESFDLVINYASESHVDRSIADPRIFTANNTDLMINILESVRKVRNLPFVHLSTDEVYGSIPFGDSNFEYQRIHKPSNPYSASKSAQESLAIAYFKTYGLPIAIINATNMTGEAQNREKFIPKAIYRIANNLEINVDTDLDGNVGTRKYLDVNDVADAVWKTSNLLFKGDNPFITEGLPFKLHISGREEISNLDLVEMIAEQMKTNPRLIISPSPRPGYDLRYELNSKTQDLVGWSPNSDTRKRIAEVCTWTMEHPDWLINDHSINS